MAELRDVVASCMRLERLGPTRPLWSDLDEPSKENFRRYADHLIALLYRFGIEMTVKGEPVPAPTAPADGVLNRYQLIEPAGATLLLRADGQDMFSATIDAGGKKSACAFSLAEATILADRVLRRDPTVRGEAGLLTKLAAAAELYRIEMGARP